MEGLINKSLSLSSMTLIQEIIDQAKNNPDSIAIQGADYVISYKELLHVAYGYANSIDVRDSWIAIDTKLDWKFYAAILACWITGNGYVPIDFNFPKSRIQEIESQVNWLMLINEYTPCLIHEIVDVNSGEKAYLLFTSGTTGAPKGVAISHANLASFANHYINHKSIKFGSEDIFLQSYDLTFDVSVFCYLMPFLLGGTLVIPPKSKVKQLGLFNAILNYNVTVTSFVPSVIRLTKDFLTRIEFPSLKYSFFSGEALMGDWAKVWMQSVPNAKVYNCYGPTETVIVCTEELLNDLDDAYFTNALPLPLGKEFEGIDLQIIEGEIIFSGEQTFQGYLNQTSIEQYHSGDLAHYDENGKLIFDGRKDNQIQWNGYRIELEEIDRLISDKSNGWVKSIYVKEIPKLVIFSNNPKEKIAELVKKEFPSYYKPSDIIQLDELPLNNNGKIDVVALRDLI